MKRFRVAHVITRLCKGGAQENTFHTVRLANSDRFEVDLIAGFPEGPEGSMEGSIEAAGGAIHREPQLVRRASPINDLRAVAHLTRVFRAKKYDLVHTHTSKAGFVGRLAARRARIPAVVHTPHGNVFHGYFGFVPTRAYVYLERLAARWTDRIVELTDIGTEESLAEGIGRREQYRTVFSGIDLSRFGGLDEKRAATRQALGIEPGDFLVGAVGRLEPVKGFAYFISAARQIVEQAPGARIVVAGQGSQLQTLRDQSKEFDSRVQFLGHREDVPELMAAFDVLVVPSINEGMGRVVLEAGAAGTPVVASRVGGLPEVVREDETGYLVAPKSSEAIAEAVLRFAKEPDRCRKFGRAARDFVVPTFGLEEMVRRIEAVYEEAIKEKGIDS